MRVIFLFLPKLENEIGLVPRRNGNLKYIYFAILSTVLSKNRFHVFAFLKNVDFERFVQG